MTVNPQPDTRPTAVFIHVPKTGGSTLNGVINRQYKHGEIVGVGFNHLESQERFLAMSDEQKSRIKCLRGHVAYGIQDHLPGPYCLATILRNPVDRFLSEYKHLVGRSSKFIHYPPEAMASPEAHLEYRASINSLNLQTAQISGYLTSGVVDGSPLEPLPDDALDKAKRNLETFDIPGVLERFDECLLLMKTILGWRKPIVSIRRNAAATRGQKLVVGDELRQQIAAATSLDMELYELARRLIDARITAAGPQLQADLEQLRRSNGLLFRFQRVYTSLMPRKLRQGARKLLGR